MLTAVWVAPAADRAERPAIRSWIGSRVHAVLMVLDVSLCSPRGANATKDGWRITNSIFPRSLLLTTPASVTQLLAPLRQCPTTKGWRTCYPRVPRPKPKAPRRACEEMLGNRRCRFNPKGAHICFPPLRKHIGIAPVSGEVMAAAVYVTIGLI